MRPTPSRAVGAFVMSTFLFLFALPVGAVDGFSPTDLGAAYRQAQVFVSGVRALRVQGGAYEKAGKAPGPIAQVSSPKELTPARLEKLIKTAWNKNPALSKPIGYANSIPAYIARRLGFSCGDKDPCLSAHDITGKEGSFHYTFVAIEGFNDILFGTSNITSEQNPSVSQTEYAVFYRMTSKGELVTFSLRKVIKSPTKTPVVTDYLPDQLAVDERKHYESEFADTKASWADFADSLPPHDVATSESLK